MSLVDLQRQIAVGVFDAGSPVNCALRSHSQRAASGSSRAAERAGREVAVSFEGRPKPGDAFVALGIEHGIDPLLRRTVE